MGLSPRSSSSSTCPTEDNGPPYGSEHLVGSMNFHDLTIILSGAFAAVACSISAFAFMRHALHFSNPAEQTKILRIIALIPAYAVLSFLAVSFPNAAVYIEPWTDAYESVALASFFLLLVIYVTPVAETREGFYQRLDAKGKKGRVIPGGSSKWYHFTWISVMQYIPVTWIVAVGIAISQAVGTYCYASSSLHFSHMWFTIVKSISVSLAFLRILGFYNRMKSEFRQHKAFSKLLAIKGIVFLSFLQQIVFLILHSTNILKPTKALSYNDITFGIPNLLLCAEMVLFAALHLYAYNVGPYKLGLNQGSETQSSLISHYQGGLLGIKAIAAAINPMEIFQALVTAVRFIAGKAARQQKGYNMGMESLRSDSYVPLSHGNALPPSYQEQQLTGIQRAHSPSEQYWRGSIPRVRTDMAREG